MKYLTIATVKIAESFINKLSWQDKERLAYEISVLAREERLGLKPEPLSIEVLEESQVRSR